MKSFTLFVTAGLAAIAAGWCTDPVPSCTNALPKYSFFSGLNEDCITISTKTVSFSGCAFNSISTHYPSTVTSHESVDCKGCVGIDITTEPQYHCPIEKFTATVTARKPTTTVETVCSVTPTTTK